VTRSFINSVENAATHQDLNNNAPGNAQHDQKIRKGPVLHDGMRWNSDGRITGDHPAAMH